MLNNHKFWAFATLFCMAMTLASGFDMTEE